MFIYKPSRANFEKILNLISKSQYQKHKKLDINKRL